MTKIAEEENSQGGGSTDGKKGGEKKNADLEQRTYQKPRKKRIICL